MHTHPRTSRMCVHVCEGVVTTMLFSTNYEQALSARISCCSWPAAGSLDASRGLWPEHFRGCPRGLRDFILFPRLQVATFVDPQLVVYRLLPCCKPQCQKPSYLIPSGHTNTPKPSF